MNEELVKKKEILLKDMKESKISILGIEESINKIKKEKKSIARFGDGELDVILGGYIGFQKYNKELANRLEEILKTEQDFCLIGLPDAINEMDNLTEESEKFWIENMHRTRKIWLSYLSENMKYCTSNITRLYIRYKDRSNSGKHFSMLKEIWKDRDVVICEGEKTRAGIGNDIFSQCKSVKRIICPAENAFEKYDEIFSELKKEDKSTLIIMALGPTATVLAYDLSKEGYQALDIGHFDIEYEWFLRNADKKEKIDNKYTNEVGNGNNIIEIDDLEYKKQIIKVI